MSLFTDIRQLSKSLCNVSGELVDACNLHLSLIEESRGQVIENLVIPPLVDRDPADRRWIQVITGQNLYLIEQGPFQPTMESFHKNTTISKGKQNSFSFKWYTDFPLIEYSIKLQKVFCFACSLFGDAVGCSKAEKSWSVEGIDAWDKMRSRDTKKAGKLTGHFKSAPQAACLEKLDNLRVTERQIDYSISKASKDRLVQKKRTAYKTGNL
eukprot:gene16867-8342_t